MRWAYSDGGRQDAGYVGDTNDCVVRAIAIAADLPYEQVYDRLHADTLGNRAVMARLELRYGARARRHASPRSGVPRKVYDPYLEELGFTWTPTMTVGTGCVVHLRSGELPDGRLVCRVSKHMVAVIDGVVHDTHDPTRDGTRCVYGYWRRETT